jgi:predicted MFS family arabinose efflux permease
MASLVYGFIRASTSGWSDGVTRVAFAAAVLLLALFLSIELRSRQPITPLHLFTNRDRSSAHAIRLLLVAGMFGMFFFLTQFVQDVLGFSPLKAGFAFLPLTIALFGSAGLASRLLPRLGAKRLTVTGIALTTAGMVWLSRVSAGGGYLSGVLGPMLLFGLGVGFPFVALTVLALSGVEPRDTGAASSLVNVMQQVGGSLGLAILVTVFGTASRNAASQSVAGASTATKVRDVLTTGISSAFTASTILIACSLLLAVVAITSRASQPGRLPAGRG